jgi:hypothetical protein
MRFLQLQEALVAEPIGISVDPQEYRVAMQLTVL